MTDIDPGYRLTVEVANGPETPAHLRLLCRLEAAVPDGWGLPRDPDFDYLEVGETSTDRTS